MWGRVMRELQADGQWPVWVAPKDPAKADVEGYGGIASFVTPAALEAFPAVFRPGLRDLLRRRTEKDGVDLDRVVVEKLWEALVDHDIPYDAPPWNPAKGQRIRDPEWLLRRHGAGTCVDLGLLFAAACLRERLDTSLVMLRGPRRAHVAVAVQLGSRPGVDRVPLGADRTGTPGIAIIDDITGLAEDKQVVLVDVTVASAGQGLERDLAKARKTAIDALESHHYSFAHLVNVAARWDAGDKQLPAPLRRGALRGRIAPPTYKPCPFPGHKKAREALRNSSGKVVVSGPQGVGKSTLAREVAVLADSGFGWFLPAASRAAFETALAEHELAERGQPARALEAVDRQGLAQAALTRLRDSEDAWVIVLDNANEGTQPFDKVKNAIDRLPESRDGQLIIATSTAGADKWPDWSEPVYLAPVPADEIADELGDEQVASLCAGRPLLMTAYSRLLDVDPGARDRLPVDTPREEDDASETGARQSAALYWSIARKRLTASAVACAERLAWMPPDLLDPGASGDDREIRGALTAIGLLGESADPGAFSMHRLFGEAVRDAVAADGRAEQTVRELLGRQDARTVLLRRGDREVTSSLAAALKDTASGLALWALGALQEVHQSASSADTFARAMRYLVPKPDDPVQATAYADCLHALGRVVNQDRKATPKQISTAIAGMRRAIDLRPPDDDIGIAKHQALLALLRQRAARRLRNPEKTRELLEVMDILEESWQRRRAHLGGDDPLVDRAYFNRAGVRVSLAKADQANAAEYLDEAERVYRATLSFRRRYYNGANPITASSVAGIGIWGYHAVWLDATDTPAEVLAEAVTATMESLDMRLKTSNKGDVAKSANMLAKLGALQSKLADGKPEEAIAEVASELEFVSELELELEKLDGK